MTTTLENLANLSTEELNDLSYTIACVIADRERQSKMQLAQQFADVVLAIKKEFPYMGATYGICDGDGTEIDFIRDLPDTRTEIIAMFNID